MKKKTEGKTLLWLIIGLLIAAIALVGVIWYLSDRAKPDTIPPYDGDSGQIQSLPDESDSSYEEASGSSQEEETSQVTPPEESSESETSEESSDESSEEASQESSAEESSSNPEEAEESSSAKEEESEASQEESESEEDIAKRLAEREARVEEILAGMTLEEKVGQMIFARFPGSKYTGIDDVETYHYGGYVLFASDFGGYTAEKVIEKIDACQEASKIPLLMAVDEEGGTVVRVSPFFRDYPFASPREVFLEGGWDGIDSYTREKCELLLSLHLNMNLAPVCDMADNYNDFMYDRSFGSDVNNVSEFIRRTVEIMNEYKVACSLKHFPGYGNNVDTHTGMAIDYREVDAYYDQDLRPFMAGIESGAGTIMVSHNIVTCFDEEYPSSLSPEIHRVLREELGFEGVIITDDMAMGAIIQYYGIEESAIQAVIAGNDMLATSYPKQQYSAILQAVLDGEITQERIEESVRRILRLKYDMGLLDSGEIEE